MISPSIFYSGVNIGSQKISLAEIMEKVSQNFQKKFKDRKYDPKEVELFIQTFLKNKKIHQKRFMSIGMTESSVKDYAKRIKWTIRIPAGTKGVSIESYNVERLNEAEFLGQRNGVLIIEKAKYCPKKDL